MVELDSITIKGFKSIASIEELKLRPINVVIGANGSGKSNFIGVFSFLNAIREGHLQEYVLKIGGADKILYFGSKVTKEIYFRIYFQEGRNQYEITLRPTELDELVPFDENVYFWDKARYPEKPYVEGIVHADKEAGISSIVPKRISRYVVEHLSQWRVYHFHDTSSNSPMKIHDIR
jgi:predicted ATPase